MCCPTPTSNPSALHAPTHAQKHPHTRTHALIASQRANRCPTSWRCTWHLRVRSNYISPITGYEPISHPLVLHYPHHSPSPQLKFGGICWRWGRGSYGLQHKGGSWSLYLEGDYILIFIFFFFLGGDNGWHVWGMYMSTWTAVWKQLAWQTPSCTCIVWST